MAIAFDAAATSGGVGLTDTITYSHDMGSGDDRYLLVSFHQLNTTLVGITSVTYNGDSLTEIITQSNGLNSFKVSIWGMVNPDSGTHDVVVTLDSSTGVSMCSNSVSLSGVDQVDPINASESDFGSNSGSPDDATLNITTTEDNSWLVDFISVSDEPTAGTGQTQRENEGITGGNAATSTKGPLSPADDYQMYWTDLDDPAFWVLAAVSLTPFEEPPPADEATEPEQRSIKTKRPPLIRAQGLYFSPAVEGPDPPDHPVYTPPRQIQDRRYKPIAIRFLYKDAANDIQVVAPEASTSEYYDLVASRRSFQRRRIISRRALGTLLFNAGEEHAQRRGIILFIRLLANNEGWLFEWPSTGDIYYRVVLHGEEIGRVADITHGLQSYIYKGSNFVVYPPPLEIMPASAGLAPSEINKPFLMIQWYGDPTVSYYQVQEFISGSWLNWFQIAEVGATVYSWRTPYLIDETIHEYQVVAYNELGQGSDGLDFDISPVVTPPDFVETLYDIDYNNTTHEIVLDLA